MWNKIEESICLEVEVVVKYLLINHIKDLSEWMFADHIKATYVWKKSPNRRLTQEGIIGSGFRTIYNWEAWAWCWKFVGGHKEAACRRSCRLIYNDDIYEGTWYMICDVCMSVY